jgi:hypothetical protein
MISKQKLLGSVNIPQKNLPGNLDHLANDLFGTRLKGPGPNGESKNLPGGNGPFIPPNDWGLIRSLPRSPIPSLALGFLFVTLRLAKQGLIVFFLFLIFAIRTTNHGFRHNIRNIIH